MSDGASAELEELRASVAALRAELQGRFGLSPRPREGSASAEQVVRAISFIDRLSEPLRERLDDLDVVQLWEELRQRFSIPGQGDLSAEVDAFGLDQRYLERARPYLDFLYERWWRVRVAGIECVPDTGRVLFVANRSGVLPYDGLMIAHAVERMHPSQRRPRFMVADWLVRLPFFQPWLARMGGVRACPENGERLLEAGEWVTAFPEGQKGALKPFRDRYRLQRFGRGGFVSLAARMRAAIVPVAVIGGEEVHPLLARPALLARLASAPVPVTPTFPLFGPLGLLPLPSQWRIRFGEPMGVDATPDRADDPLYVSRAREAVRARIQTLIEEELPRRSSVWS